MATHACFRPRGVTLVVACALAGMGPTAIHRRTWVFMESIPWTGVPRRRPATWDDPAQPSLFGE